MKRYNMARDENEKEIVDALESIGCTVHRLDTPVDLLIGRGGKNVLIEIKNPNKPKGDRKKTPAQVEFFKDWQGQVTICETPEQAIEVVSCMTI